ncbi:MAG: ATP-binding protein, partial [Sphingomonadales bacterium]
GIRLSLADPGHPTVLLADPRLMKQVAINLIGNAIKFTQPGGSVVVTIEASPLAGCFIRVTDTGIGIAAEDLDKVLEPFVQVESTFARKFGGTGLGLPLVRRVMELHGGAIAIESTLGSGTTVTVSLPGARVIGQSRSERDGTKAKGTP